MSASPTDCRIFIIGVLCIFFIATGIAGADLFADISSTTEDLQSSGDLVSAGPAADIPVSSGGAAQSTFIAASAPEEESPGTAALQHPRGVSNPTGADPGQVVGSMSLDGSASVTSLLSDFDMVPINVGNPQLAGPTIYSGSAPGAASRYTGEMELFWMNTSENKMYTKWKSPDTGNTWLGWAWPTATGTFSGYNPLSAAAMNRTTIYVFGRGSDNNLYFTYYSDSTGWHPWAKPAGATNQILSGTGPSAIQTGGIIYIFFVGTDYRIKKLEFSGNGQWSGSIPGVAQDGGGGWYSTPAAVAWYSNNIVVYGEDSNGYLSMMQYIVGDGWGSQISGTGWSKPGGVPAVVSRIPGTMDIFYKRASDGKLVTAHENPTGWTSETSLDTSDGGWSFSSDMDPAVVSWSEYEMSVFVRTNINRDSLPPSKSGDIDQFELTSKRPHITTVNPRYLLSGQASTFYVNGEGNRFFPDSVIYVNGAGVPTTTGLEMVVSATTTLSGSGQRTVTVYNPPDGYGGGGFSDNQADIYVMPPVRIGVYQNGIWYLDRNGNRAWDSGEGGFRFGGTGWKPVSGDWTGDGSMEIGVYKDGGWYLDLNGDGAFAAVDGYRTFGSAGWNPVVGDWNGDYKTEIGVYKDGAWYLDVNGDGAFSTGDRFYRFGAAGWSPVIGDWDGDWDESCADKIGVYLNGAWYLDVNGDGTFTAADRYCRFGAAGWNPVVGSWNSNPADRIGVSYNGAWYLDMNGDGTFTAADRYCSFGAAGWNPVVLDWNNDKKSEIGVYKDGTWYLDLNGNFAPDSGEGGFPFGVTGYTAVVGRWS